MMVFSFDEPIKYVEKIDVITKLRQRALSDVRVRWPYGIIEKVLATGLKRSYYYTATKARKR
jgi:hypothetical protein